MSFRVSNGFNLHETIDRWRLLKWFHFGLEGAAETTAKKRAGVSCFKVSVVSLLIYYVNETEKVLGRCLKGCVHIVVGTQNSTGQLADGRVQRLQHAL